MTTKTKPRPTSVAGSAETVRMPEPKTASVAATRKAFTALMRSIDSNLSNAHRFADEAKKRLG